MRQEAGVVDTPQYDKRADLEVPRETTELIGQ